MDCKDFCFPILSSEEIEREANSFRKQFWNNPAPIDMEKIIDLKLKLSIAPILGLRELCCTDALITSDFKLIYVDKDGYLDDQNQNRLRFSFAHEIGHFVLHRDVYRSFNIKDFISFYKYIEKISSEQYDYLESQANKFANCLLE